MDTSSLPAYFETPSLGGMIGGKVLQYRDKQNIYRQGTPADAILYIQQGRVRLTNKSKRRPSAVIAILGAGDFFGAECLAGSSVRTSDASTMTSASIRSIPRQQMVKLLCTKHEVSTSLVSYLLSSLKVYQGFVAELLTLNAEQRLASILLLLAKPNSGGTAFEEVPDPTHQELAEMVGITRSRANVLMNAFRKRGYINYGDKRLEVNRSLRKVLASK